MKQSKKMRMTALIYFPILCVFWTLLSLFLVPGRCVCAQYDRFIVPGNHGAESDFQPDICKKPAYNCTGHFARIPGFAMHCNRVKRI